MNDYEAKKAAKIDRFRGFAENAAKRAEAADASAHRIADFIPLGQPILIGHHSERRHRRDIGRIQRGFERAHEEQTKANYWERRAKAVESDTSIQSDDPEACAKLRAKIEELETLHARMLAVNKALRAKDPVKAGLIIGMSESMIQRFLTAERYSWEKHPGYPSYSISNSGANIRRYKERLATLEREATEPPKRRSVVARRSGRCDECRGPIVPGNVITKICDSWICEPCADS